jgi:methionyl-tRNA synthetase
MNKSSQYITTTLPYVNADPHVGFAMELIRADILARYYTLLGHDVFFNTGTDEHGQKLLADAEKAGKDVKEYVDEYATQFKGLKEILGISDHVNFIRTTDKHHVRAAQEFWKLVDKNGYIYKKSYTAKYCVGCELEKTDSELVDGQCPFHPNKELELIDEENYFFKFSAFEKPLLEFYDKNPEFVLPDFRFNEIRAFIGRGLQDFSISRLASKMSWGIPVPGDEDHVMYVWFDALVNYISTLGWNGPLPLTPSPIEREDNAGEIKSQHEASSMGGGLEEVSLFEKYWINGNPIQYCGKDNLRQQTAMWQAMLMAAGLPNTHQVIVNGFFTGEGGIKMSKSIGNVVNPYDVVTDYGTDALRYYVVGAVSMFEDSPFYMERFREVYQSALANGIGNLVSRTMNMVVSYDVDISNITIPAFSDVSTGYASYFESRELNRAAEYVWNKISDLDKFIADTKPFTVVKTDPDRAHADLQYVVKHLAEIAVLLKPIIPTTSETIINLIQTKSKPESPLFMRRD